LGVVRFSSKWNYFEISTPVISNYDASQQDSKNWLEKKRILIFEARSIDNSQFMYFILRN